jgi:thymidylate synthase
MNKYHNLLQSIVTVGRNQQNKKGGIKYLINEKISMDKGELVELFSIHKVAKKKLKAELEEIKIKNEEENEKTLKNSIN